MTLEQVSKAKAPAGTTPPPAAERDLGARPGEARLSGWHAQCGCGHIRREQQLPGGGRHRILSGRPLPRRDGVRQHGRRGERVVRLEPPALFLVACFGVAFWRNVDERRGKGVYDQGRDEKKARITRAGGAPRGVEGAWHDGVSSRYRRQAGIPRGLRDCR